MSSNTKFEQRVCIAAGFCVLIFTMALIWRNLPLADPNLARMARIILSLGVGVLGGTIPGFLDVEYNLKGFSIRAGGASALFVITFFGSPYVDVLNLKNPEIEISSIPQVDIRTKASPQHSEEYRLAAPAVLIVPFSARNVSEPSLSGYLNSSYAELEIHNSVWKFNWAYFVNMHEEAFGVWLAIQESAAPQALKSGEVLNKEILYISDDIIRWEDILNEIQNSRKDIGVVTAHYEFDKQLFKQSCTLDLSKWGTEIRKFIEKTGISPGRVTMRCVHL